MTKSVLPARRPGTRSGVGTHGLRAFAHHPLMAPTVSAVGAIGVMAYVRLVSPYDTGSYPACPFLVVTGWYCPGCGSLRALHELAGLDILGALGMNLLTPLALVYVVATWAAWTVRSATGRPRRWLAPPAALWTLLGAIVAFAVARNIAMLAPWLAPGGG